MLSVDFLEGHYTRPNYLSLGIDFVVSHAKAAYILNRALQIRLERTKKDFSPIREAIRSDASPHFPCYFFCDKDNEEEWIFVVNRGNLDAPLEKNSLKFSCQTDVFFLSEMRTFGGFLIVKGEVSSEKLIEKLVHEKDFRWVWPIKVDKFKNYLETFFLYGT